MTVALQLAMNMALDQARTCLRNGDGEQALQLMHAALAGAPDNPAVHVGLGVALRFAGQIEAAAQAFTRVLSLQANRADAQVYLGMIRLAQGRQSEGWPLYQARWRDVNWTDKLRYPEQHLWQGQFRRGLRLLLWGEQGLGDILQFARYAPWLLRQLQNQGATLVLEVPAQLCSLLRTSWPCMDIAVTGQSRGHFDCHLPLMDLPRIWGNQVGPGGLPWQPLRSPYLSALPDLLAQHRGAMPVASGLQTHPPLRAGLAWQGRPTHPDDRWRSIHPRQLQALFAVPGIRWVSLQKDATHHPSWLPQDLALCQDFADTARIVDGLDLIISIDSSMAHLAAALGKPVWLLLPKVVDWRWQLTGESTPWYPSMRLFRQAHDESWDQVASRVASVLLIESKTWRHQTPTQSSAAQSMQ